MRVRLTALARADLLAQLDWLSERTPQGALRAAERIHAQLALLGEFPLAAQVKLLRALQEGEVEPVGGRKSAKVDVRIVSATNRDLIADVKAGRFREDLFYRLHVFPIGVPPLRQRPEDIPELTRHFLARIAAEEGKRVRAITGEALALLAAYRWPGNVRQLENTIFRAVVLADGEEVGVNEFPQVAAQLEAQGVVPVGGTPQEWGAYLERERVRWSTFVAEHGIKAE